MAATFRSVIRVMISLLPSSLRVMFHLDDYRTRIKTDLQYFFALTLPSGIKTI